MLGDIQPTLLGPIVSPPHSGRSCVLVWRFRNQRGILVASDERSHDVHLCYVFWHTATMDTSRWMRIQGTRWWQVDYASELEAALSDAQAGRTEGRVG